MTQNKPPHTSSSGQKEILIQGAREHNLQNFTLSLPKDSLVVITGPSGSGKSSLAFHTLYAEGQRRYVESLSAYARQFLDMMPKPDVDRIEGLSPAIAIEQKTTSKNPRSTVGTITEIYDYLRLLFARVGTPISPTTGKPIKAQTVPEMVAQTLKLPSGRVYITAPLIRGRKGEFRKELEDLGKRGFLRVWLDGQFYTLEDVPLLDKNKKHTLHVVVDRLILGEERSDPALATRLHEAFETALRTSPDQLALAFYGDPLKEMLFSATFSCPESGFTIEKLEPRLFSFNSPFGACPACDGLGTMLDMDLDKIVPDESLSLEDGAIAPWAGSFAFYYLQILKALARHYDFSVRIPFAQLDQRVRDILLYGSGTEAIPMNIQDEKRSFKSEKPFEGVIPMLKRRHKERQQQGETEEISKWHKSVPCPTCQGSRLKPEALCVKIGGLSIADVTALSIEDTCAWIEKLPHKLSEKELTIGRRILKETQDRLGFLRHVGVGYLNLMRSAGTLSGGEAQRIRLASQIGSGLTGVLYVLDEPSIGLHPRDNERLIGALHNLRNLGNTLVVVEHDEEMMWASDYLVDMGPAAGSGGGQIVAEGPPKAIASNPKSLTGHYLSGKQSIPLPAKRRPLHQQKVLMLKGAKAHNLKNLSVTIPLGIFTCVTGVSGGGKSSLILETLYKALAKRIHKTKDEPGPYTSLKGVDLIDKIINIDQSPIGRTPRSNPATYTGLFAPLRDWFAALPEAKARGYTPGRFSFNVRGGRCEACSGDGVIKVEMHFLPDIFVTCDVCQGQRYQQETLNVRFKNKSIADVLAMTVDEAALFFDAMPSIRDRLQMLQKVGLGYIQLGQRATTLSGGEAQRIKLSKELARRATGQTLYILDEPTTGLHFDDVKKLLDVLNKLVDQGNTVLVIEHNLDVIKTADHIIDIGPEGGEAGGQIIAEGPPEAIAKNPQSFTGKFLKNLLGKGGEPVKPAFQKPL